MQFQAVCSEGASVSGSHLSKDPVEVELGGCLGKAHSRIGDKRDSGFQVECVTFLQLMAKVN